MRVLIAEDSPLYRTVLEGHFIQWGYEVVSCADGEQAWRLIEAEDAPFLAVIDWIMPGLNGLQLCRKIRRHKGLASVYILLLTSRDKKEDMLTGLQAGADDYIAKPFDEDVLRARAQVGARALQRQEEVHEREETLRDFFDNATEMIQQVAPDGGLVHVNRAWRQCLGYSAAEVAQLSLWDIIHPDSAEHCQLLFQRVMAGEELDRIEAFFLTKDGKKIAVEGSASCAFKDGKPVMTRSIFRDISGRKRREAQEVALSDLRQEVWKMQSAEDIEKVMAALKDSLEKLEVRLHGFGVNVIEGIDPDKAVQDVRYYTFYPGRGMDNWKMEKGGMGAQIVSQMWRTGAVVYRCDLEKEDTYGEWAYFSSAFSVPIRSVIDIPFSHGTLAANSATADAFDERDIATLQALAQVLSEGFQRVEDLQRLAASEARYRILVETPNYGVLLLDREGNYLYISPKVEEITGYAPDEFYRDRQIAYRIVHPEYVEWGGEMYERAKLGLETIDKELRLTTKEGVEKWLMVSYYPVFDSDGGYSSLQIVVQDITESKRADAERARLDEQLQRLDFLYALRTRLAAARTVGEVAQLAGDALVPVLAAFPPAGGFVEYGQDRWAFGADGQVVPFSYQRPLVWGDQEHGRLHLFCGVELTRAQERLLLDEVAAQISQSLEARELESQLLQSARLVSLGEMAANVAHELNQPLTTISATAEGFLLRQEKGIELSAARAQEMMQQVLGMVERMEGIIQHLRVFSRDTSEEPSALFSVNDVIHSSLSLLRSQLKSHGIELEVELAENLPAVAGTANQVEQVLLNLLANARDALDEKEEATAGDASLEKCIWIRSQDQQLDGSWVVIEVEDNGTGIDEVDRNRLFEPFFTTKGEERGTGLGLSISYAIVHNHGGRIGCESRKGEGTTFRLLLPAGRAVAELDEGESCSQS